uniref:PARP-type domain-containing protein n=1 Tax=Panagrolaimus davidi TaxID=227884 RepID=A0A914QVJ5_9BILA
MGVRFHYARKLCECNECGEKIQVGALVSFYHQKNQSKWHHFDCFLKQRNVDEYRKSDIMFWMKRRPYFERRSTVSLEEYDKHPHTFQLAITPAELTKIRKLFALAKEHKTESFIPWASEMANLNCHDCIFAFSNSVVGGEQLGLYFQGNNYHPKCLLKTRKVNVDAKEIRNYDSLSEDDKKHLGELFKKNDDAFFLPCCIPSDDEHCSFLKCREKHCHDYDLRIRDHGIRYQTKTYHLKCFALMGKVNMDGKEIENYNILSHSQKLCLQKLKKSDDFDIPLIEKAIRNDYCTLPDCPAANGRPSKFPWPYTIKQDELQIKYRGDNYHPRCFKSAKKSKIDIKAFLGYDSLNQRTKQMLEENYEDTEMDNEEGESSSDDDDSDDSNSSDFGSDQMDDDNDIEGPPAKKSKMEPQMQDGNVSDEIIQNEFDNDQEPFDGTNVKEEMSEPIISQMNTLNESYNAGVGPQIINRREEREGNQESGNQVKGEPEIVTLDDDDEVETNEVRPEIKQESVAESYNFDVPSGDFLRSTLKKFDIEHTNEVYTFYGNNIKYTKIPATATLCTTFPTSSSIDSFFKCLSLYFTGKEEHFSVIKMGIQAYFFSNSKTFGIIDGIDFSKLQKSSLEFQKFNECNELTNAHFTIICSWFNCRIGIFSNGRLSGKYGNWDEKHPIFLIEENNGFYKPVLALN